MNERNKIWRLFLLTWALTAGCVLVENRDLLHTPLYPTGDEAANFLSIERAKQGREIYGNYSRFDFHHPGPAFFYVYALGEYILYDGTKIAPLPYNAHLITGILLQAAFISIGIALLAIRTSRPHPFAFLFVGVVLLHFSFVPGAFESVWPPYVLMMPFALFMIAAGNVLSGRPQDFWALIFSSVFLIHGHIAQPLFVAPVLLYILFYYRTGAGRSWRELLLGQHRFFHFTMIGLFALPFAVDLFNGRDSNYFRIWKHFVSYHHAMRPTWVLSVFDVASYFTYSTNQDVFFRSGSARIFLKLFPHETIAMALSLFILLVVFSFAWRKRHRLPFLKSGLLLVAAEVILAVIWAKRQDGGLTSFNSFYIFGLMVPLWLAAGVALCENFPRWRVTALTVVVYIALGFNVGRLNAHEFSKNDLGRSVAGSMDHWLARETKPNAVKLLIFPHDSWLLAVTIAAELQRRQIPFFVSDQWSIMFGRDHGLKTDSLENMANTSWWIIDPSSLLSRRPSPELVEKQVAVSSRPASANLPLAFDFGFHSDPESLLRFGFGEPEPNFSWTVSPRAMVKINPPIAKGDIMVSVTASGFVHRPIRNQTVAVTVNGVSVGSLAIGDRSNYRLVISQAVWNRGYGSGVEIDFDFPDAMRPGNVSASSDLRLLSICLYHLSFSEAP